jgi:tRNA A37 threonylcarbamoyltransferase TsaD
MQRTSATPFSGMPHSSDNAAMVACLATHRSAQGGFDDLTLDALPNML